jgi:hypothetical protein
MSVAFVLSLYSLAAFVVFMLVADIARHEHEKHPNLLGLALGLTWPLYGVLLVVAFVVVEIMVLAYKIRGRSEH